MIAKHRDGLTRILGISLVVSLGLFSVASCVVAEFNRAKFKDIKLAGRLCYLPKSRAFAFGIAALVCWSVAQVIGNLLICRKKTRTCKAKTSSISTFLLFTSWMSFVIGLILLSTATSMNGKQEYATGWLEGECFVVKDGVFIGSAILAFISLASILVCPETTVSETSQVGRESTVHQQLDPK